MFRKIDFFSSEDKNFSWWWFGIKVGVIAALIIWWWLENKKFSQETTSIEPREEPQSIQLPEKETSQVDILAEEMAKSPVAPPTEPDDLTKIEGIGPKINATLQEAGVRTFLQLAASKPAVLKQVLTDAGIRVGFPDTWPEQAALAAKADWTTLEELQSSLQGGRRVNS